MKTLSSFLVILALSSAFSEKKVRYDNFKAFTINIADESQLLALQNFRNEQGVIFWEQPVKVKSKVNVAVPPQQLKKFQETMAAASTIIELMIDNIQDLIDDETLKKSGKAEGDFDWTSYHNVDEIYAWINKIAAQYPNQVTITDIGDTYEGRKMKVVKISFQPGNRGILIESNIHAREWISSATATFLINELLTSSNPEIMDIAKNVDWYFIPLANPDGLQYSHDVDRMWSSTRSKGYSVICNGADSNRNFAHKWMRGGGASMVKCSDDYGGPEPFSEIESRNTDNFLKENSAKFDFFLSFHSYGLILMIPYGDGERPSNFDEHMAIGEESVAWMGRLNGRFYYLGNSQDSEYMTSGSSVDHAVGRYGIPFGFTYEMRDQNYRFMLPADRIIANSQEIVEAMKGLVYRARILGYLQVSA